MSFFPGYRPKTYTFTEDVVLDGYMEKVTADTRNGDVLINLPSNPLDGQVHNVKKIGDNKLVVDGNGRDIYSTGFGNSTKDTTSDGISFGFRYNQQLDVWEEIPR